MKTNKNVSENILKSKPLSPSMVSGIIILITLLIMSSVTLYTYFRETQSELKGILANERIRVGAMQDYVDKTLSTIEHDLHILATHEDIKEYFRSGKNSNLNKLADEYYEMSLIKGIYDQVRFLDEDGQEKIRVNNSNNRASIVAKDNLQNKGDRYYFTDTNSLNQGELFVSPFDLNIEHGEIEKPQKPIIRFGRPLFDDNGDRSGVVLINYLGNDLLSGLDRFKLSDAGKLLMFNQNGYWIKAPRTDQEWGFMYESKKDQTVANTFPEEWLKLSSQSSGQINTDNGLFTFSKIFPLSREQISSTGSKDAFSKSNRPVHINEYSWTIVSYLPKSALNTSSKTFLEKILIVDLLLLLLVVVITWRLHLAIKARLDAERTAVNLYDLIRIINRILRHDILGKLTSIAWALELSELIKTNKEVENAYKNVQGGIELVKRMKELELSAKGASQLQCIDLNPILKEIAETQNMKINIDGEVKVFVDEAMNSVFENLIRNAKIHGGVNKVDISIQEKEGLVIISIKDTGSGVPKHLTEKIFEEGFTSGDTGNTGLGLYIVKKTVERYGGTIRLEHNKPHGCNFIIELVKSHNC